MMKRIFKLFAFASGLLAAPAAFAGLIVSAPVDVIGNLPLAQFTADGYGTNSYKDWGNEPFVAVNPLNTSELFVSSFSYSSSSTSRVRMSSARQMAGRIGPRCSRCLRQRTA